MRVGIIGASGLVGSHLLERLKVAGHEVLSPRHSEVDVTNVVQLQDWCRGSQPQLIINCSVIDVDRCEREPSVAELVNVIGPRALAELATEMNSTFLHFSTNYVFDGKEHGKIYTQEDKAEPINVYGKTKREGEIAVLSACKSAIVVRTSWVFGPNKENFLSTVHKKLKAGEKVRAIGDVWASATFVEDLVERTMSILQSGSPSGIFHIVNSGVLSYADFTEEVARICHVSPSCVERGSEDDAKRFAARPRYTPIVCTLSDHLGLHPLRDWRVALAAFLATQ